jgi:quercetin dioxygenase-like cupin family protein
MEGRPDHSFDDLDRRFQERRFQMASVGMAFHVRTFWVGCAASLVFAGAAEAQDPMKVGTGIYSLVFENERVRVCDIKFDPGEKIAPHSHPDHFVYVLSAGTLEVEKPDGSKTLLESAPGQVLWIPAETHWATNVGKTEFHAIVVELKEGAKPTAAPAKPAQAATPVKKEKAAGDR